MHEGPAAYLTVVSPLTLAAAAPASPAGSVCGEVRRDERKGTDASAYTLNASSASLRPCRDVSMR